jgi:hypothetical protein
MPPQHSEDTLGPTKQIEPGPKGGKVKVKSLMLQRLGGSPLSQSSKVSSDRSKMGAENMKYKANKCINKCNRSQDRKVLPGH